MLRNNVQKMEEEEVEDEREGGGGKIRNLKENGWRKNRGKKWGREK